MPTTRGMTRSICCVRAHHTPFVIAGLDPAIHPLAKSGFAFCEERWTPGSSPGVTVVGTDESKIVSEDGALPPPRAPAAAHAGAAGGRARAGAIRLCFPVGARTHFVERGLARGVTLAPRAGRGCRAKRGG